MSRSYKKNPIVTSYRPARKFYKRQANKAVRRLSPEYSIPEGSWYKGLYNSLSIKTYAFVLPTLGWDSWDRNLINNPLYGYTWWHTYLLRSSLLQRMGDSSYRRYYIK